MRNAPLIGVKALLTLVLPGAPVAWTAPPTDMPETGPAGFGSSIFTSALAPLTMLSA